MLVVLRHPMPLEPVQILCDTPFVSKEPRVNFLDPRYVRCMLSDKPLRLRTSSLDLTRPIGSICSLPAKLESQSDERLSRHFN